MTKHFYSYLLGAILTAMLSVSGYAKEHNNYDHITKTFAKANNTDLSSQVVLSNFKIYEEGFPDEPVFGYTSPARTVLIYELDWNLSSIGGNISTGDYFTFKLPNTTTATYTDNQELVVNGIVVGKVSTTANSDTVKVEFNNQATGMANYRGTFSIPIIITLKEGDNTFINPDGSTTTVIYTTPSTTIIVNEVLGKHGQSAYVDYIEWFVYINKSSQDFGTSNLVVEDKVKTESGSFISLIYNPTQYTFRGKDYTFYLHEVKYNNPSNANDHTYEYINGNMNNSHIPVTLDKEEYDAEIAKGNQDIAYAEIFEGGQKFRLHLGNNVGNRSFILRYQTTLPNDDSLVSNSAVLIVDDKETLPYESLNGNPPNGTSVIVYPEIRRNIGTITFADNKDRISITKYDAESGVRLANAVFRLTYPDGTTSVELTTGANGTVQTGVLDAGTYTLTEITAPEGYALLKTPTKVEVVYNEATFVNIPNYPIEEEPAPTFCLIEPNTSDSTILNTDFGITTLGRAANSLEDKETWPLSRKGGWVALESNSKPFVVTRTTSDKITNPENGMLIFDTTDKCLKLYDGTKWTCFSTPACPTK